MKVSKELLEKYHSGYCNDQEKVLVETWLYTEDDDTGIIPLDEAQKNTLKHEIWDTVESETIKASRTSKVTHRANLSSKFYWSAAAAVILVCCGAAFMLSHNNVIKEYTVTPHNISTPIVQGPVHMFLGQGSTAFFDSDADRVDFCGLVKITPKTNIKIAFAARCEKSGPLQKEVFMTEGKTYFALDLKDAYQEELLVMSEDHIYELPPLVRNAIRAQFGI
ncbi:hypothetical protein G5B30_15705 [Sphingobacterium sp. SGG-5]|uniref:hypothetical protein n=1 Tax=Sphingobacterium sp. SGG-5 TaxID=2710881 RepID=UPI0013ED1232|nr:hypothetical protein [Sphingobacterium sp. SGG-5]NGM63355.1 hypothetical protein [Sphingobacterium sp. SGG-5]